MRHATGSRNEVFNPIFNGRDLFFEDEQKQKGPRIAAKAL
jgi:hypothetical protein